MSSASARIVLAAAAMLAGCSSLDPYSTAPLAAPPGTNPAPRVAICYNRLTTSLAAVKAAAEHECGAGTVAEPADTDYYLQYCPVLLPARATFMCTAAAHK